MAEKPRNDADAKFAKLQRANDAKKAMSEYEVEAAAVRAKTARLRALRGLIDRTRFTVSDQKGRPPGDARFSRSGP